MHIKCNACGTAVDRSSYNSHTLLPCVSCGTPLLAAVFPSHDKGIKMGRNGETILTDEDASCFYHHDKKAAVACESCGRFLCSLCDIQLNNQHICTSCIESGRKKGNLKGIERSHVRYDLICSSLAIIPLLVFYTTILTAPATVFLVIRHWNDEMGLIPHSRAPYVFAMIFALLEITAWVFVIAGIAGAFN